MLNTLDGFNVDARVSIPFSGPIDLTTVTPDTVFLVDPQGHRTALDRLVWTAATNTLHGVPHTYLSQHTPYVLIVTDGVKAADGHALDTSSFRQSLQIGQGARSRRRALPRSRSLGALTWSHVSPEPHRRREPVHDAEHHVAAREGAAPDRPVDIPHLRRSRSAPRGERAVFPFSSVIGENFHRQTGTVDVHRLAAAPPQCDAFPGAIGTVAYGSFSSPDYENSSQVIPAVGSAFGVPARAEHEHAVLQPLAAVRHGAGGRLARRDRRARLHRLEAGLPDHDRVDAREERRRDDRDQRRRPRRRPARDDHRLPKRRPAGDVLGRRPRRSTRTATARSTRRRASMPRRSSPPSATATASARP